MRILNVIQCTDLGGIEQASLRLMTALKARGHELRAISLNPIAKLGPLLEDAGIPAVGLDYRRRGKVGSFLDLRRSIAAQDADALIMTGHNFMASLALGNACRGHRMMAMHFHHEGVMPAWQWRLIYRAARMQFQAVSFPSDYVRREAEAIYPPIRSIARTVRNPLELPPLPATATAKAFRDKLGIPVDAPLIGNAGWLIARKRFDVFLHTAREILKRRPEAHFVIAGDGDEREALRRLAESLGIAQRVIWAGWLPDLAPFYAGIDVLLFNSDWDAFGNTPAEAMSRGTPVVASIEHGGLDEILDGTCGWLMRQHDPAELAKAVDDALSSEGKARAARARTRIEISSEPNGIAETVEQMLSGGLHAQAS